MTNIAQTNFPKELSQFKENIDPVFVIPLSNNSTTNKSFWVLLRSSSGVVEGKLHLPKKQLNKLIIFEPGFPGDGSTRLEKLWLNGLLGQGYTVFTARHSGTIINGKYSSNYINCPEKQQWARENNQKILGSNPPYAIANWLKEPLIVLESFSPHFEEIYLTAHSFGPLATVSSFIDFIDNSSNEAKKIKRFVSLCGTLGRVRGEDDPILKQWLHYLNLDSTRERIQIGDTGQNISTLYDTYNKIHEQADKIPESLDLVFITPYGNTKDSIDELVPPLESIDFMATLGGRGILVIDKTQRANEERRQMAHDMDNLKSDVLLHYLEGKFDRSKQFFVILK